jgi:hypothetical protein
MDKDVFIRTEPFISTKDGFLSEINLQENNLQGTLPDDFSLVTDLEVLNLAGNFLVGEIPSSLYGLATLRILDLSHNGLVGVISDDIYHLTSLESLILSSNSFEGPLPWGLGYLERAHIIHLQDNFFNGTIPPAIVNLVNVTDWDLTSNYFDQGSFLPYPLCNFCDRTWRECSIPDCRNKNENCVEGYLLACTSPRAYQVHRSKNELAAFDCSKPRELRSIIHSIPEGCVHRIG